MSEAQRQGEIPDEIEALLPWYAAGALSLPERARVEAALAARPELRLSLATLEEDRDETVTLNEALGAPRGDVWARVMQGVEVAPKRPSLRARFAILLGFDGRSQSFMPLAATMAGVVLLVQAAALVTMLRPGARPPTYQTVTAGRSTADALVVFSPEAKMGDVAALLERAGASVAGGPKSGGLYEIRLKSQPVTRAEIGAALKILSASPLVTMALPGAGE
jgi:anti-sigma-K factor RskA